MAIIRQEDVVNGGEIVVISGVVERIIIKEAERTAKNLEFGITHIASLCVDSQWINYISLSIKEGRTPDISVNAGTKAQPKWVQIQETDEVKVVVTEKLVGDKAYYNAKKSGIKLVKKNATPGQQSQQSTGSNSQPKAKFDATGVQVGQSLNGALNFLITWGVVPSNENIVKYGKLTHKVTEQVKEYVKKVNPDASEYEQGARAGLAVLTACKLVGTEQDFEQGVLVIAKDIIDNVFPVITDFVKNGDKAKENPEPKITRPAPAKKAATKAVQVEEAEFPEEEDLPPF